MYKLVEKQKKPCQAGICFFNHREIVLFYETSGINQVIVLSGQNTLPLFCCEKVFNVKKLVYETANLEYFNKK